MVAYIITSVANLITLKAKLGVKINYYDTLIKPAYSAVFMILSVVFTYQYVYNSTMSNTLGVFISIALGGIVYMILIFLFGIFDYKYVKSKFARG